MCFFLVKKEKKTINLPIIGRQNCLENVCDDVDDDSSLGSADGHAGRRISGLDSTQDVQFVLVSR